MAKLADLLHDTMSSGAGAAELCVVDVLNQPSSVYKPLQTEGDTYNRFRAPNGEWTPERARLHNEIIASRLEHFTPVAAGDTREVTWMGGGPASGKSSLRGRVPMDNHVLVDPDDVRTLLPEYKELLAKGDPNAAAFVHEEVSYLSKELAKRASSGNYDMLFDGVGDGSLEHLTKKVQTFSKGARVNAHYVTVDVDTAIERAAARAKKTGRDVPLAYIREAHRAVSQVVPEAIANGLFDDFTLWDTSSGRTIKVATAKGNQLTVHDAKLWHRFLDKGR